MDREEIRRRYLETVESVTAHKRQRILLYGSQADRLLLRCFEDMGDLLGTPLGKANQEEPESD